MAKDAYQIQRYPFIIVEMRQTWIMVVVSNMYFFCWPVSKLQSKIYQQKYQQKHQKQAMNQFRESRKQSSQRNIPKQYAGSLSLISPQKKREQGAGQASGSLESPPPSNRFLSQTLLQKQALNSRKYQQTQQRLREKQIAYRHLNDMYDKVMKEKEGIQSSLQQQIQMYRNLIKEIQLKAEERLREVQKAFKEEMERKLAQKQQEARIMQVEKEELEKFVDQLEKIGDDLENKLTYTTNDLKNTQDSLRKTQDERKMFMQKFQASEQYNKAQNQKYQDIVDKLKQQAINGEREWRDKIDEANKEKDKALKQLEKQFRNQIAKIQDKHQQEKGDRKDQIKNMMDSFQAQKAKLNQLIAAKDKALQDHYKQSKQGTQKIANQIRGYEQQIQSMANQKARLFEQVDTLNSENTHLNILIKELQMNTANQKKSLQAYILKLKQQVAFGQANFLRQRDRNSLNFQDSSKQIIGLKRELSIIASQNQKLKQNNADSSLLTEQCRKLRDMLVQSSYELQKCKGEFVKMSKQRQLMALRLNESGYEIGALRRIKMEREDEARGWRDSYYLSRSRSIRR